MVKLINYSLITALPVATSVNLHIRNLLFTRSRDSDARLKDWQCTDLCL